MATELAKAYVQIVPSADGISDGIKSALGDGESIGSQFGAKIGGGISTAFKAGGVAVAALSTAAVGLGKAMFDSAKSTAEAGDVIDKQSQKLGMSAEAYQKLSYACNLSGTSIDSFKKGVVNITKDLADAKDGSDEVAKKYKALGVEIKNTDGSFKSSDQLLKDSLLSLANMGDETERNAKANEIFGKSYMELLPLLNSGADGINSMMDEAEKYGMVMSDDAVKASAAFQDSLARLQGTFDGLKNNIMGNLLPSITSITDGISDLFAGNDGAEKKISEGVNGIVKNVSDNIPQLISIVSTVANTILKVAPDIIKALAKGIIDALPELIRTAADIILELADGIIDALPELIPAAVDIILELVDALIDNMDKIIEGGFKLIIGLIEGLTKALPKLIAAVPEIVKAIWNTLKNTNWMDLGKQIIQGIISGLKSCGSAILEAAGSLKDSIMNAVKSKFGIHSPSKLMKDEVGKYLALGISEGFVDEADSVNKTMADAINTQFDVSASANIGSTLAQNSINNATASTTDNLLQQMLNKLDNIANMSIMLDSGVLVGATAPAMNTALGRISAREGLR